MATGFHQKLKQPAYRSSYSQSLNFAKQPPQQPVPYQYSHSFNDLTEPELSEINLDNTPLCSDADSDSDFDENLIQTTTKWYMAFPDDDSTTMTPFASPSPNMHKFIPITRSEPYNNNNNSHQQETDLFAAKTKIYLPSQENKNKNQLYSEGDGRNDTVDKYDAFPITMMGYNNINTSEGKINDNVQECVTLMGHIQTNDNGNGHSDSDMADICVQNNKSNITLMGNGDLSLKMQFGAKQKQLKMQMEAEGNNDFGENENGITLMGYCHDNNVPFITKK